MNFYETVCVCSFHDGLTQLRLQDEKGAVIGRVFPNYYNLMRTWKEPFHYAMLDSEQRHLADQVDAAKYVTEEYYPPFITVVLAAIEFLPEPAKIGRFVIPQYRLLGMVKKNLCMN